VFFLPEGVPSNKARSNTLSASQRKYKNLLEEFIIPMASPRATLWRYGDTQNEHGNTGDSIDITSPSEEALGIH
jgi:hypothetical protein